MEEGEGTVNGKGKGGKEERGRVKGKGKGSAADLADELADLDMDAYDEEDERALNLFSGKSLGGRTTSQGR